LTHLPSSEMGRCGRLASYLPIALEHPAPAKLAARERPTQCHKVRDSRTDQPLPCVGSAPGRRAEEPTCTRRSSNSANRDRRRQVHPHAPIRATGQCRDECTNRETHAARRASLATGQRPHLTALWQADWKPTVRHSRPGANICGDCGSCDLAETRQRLDANRSF